MYVRARARENFPLRGGTERKSRPASDRPVDQGTRAGVSYDEDCLYWLIMTNLRRRDFERFYFAKRFVGQITWFLEIIVVSWERMSTSSQSRA